MPLHYRLALAALPLLLVACSNGGPGATTCADFCVAFADACGATEHCMQRCRGGEAVADFVGCQSAHDALAGCRFDRVDFCDADLVAELCVDEEMAYDRCVTEACRLRADSPICRDHCLSTCEASPPCEHGPVYTCDDLCDRGLDQYDSWGCGAEGWDAILCTVGEMPAAACSWDVCAAENRALVACAQPDPAPTAAYYEACHETGCAEGVCTRVGTPTTRGSVCTVRCDTTADCPGNATCVATEDGNYCLDPCADDGGECPDEMVCRVASPTARVCMPDR